MQLVAEIFLPSPVSARDVTASSSPSCITPFDQYMAIRKDFVAPLESAKPFVAMGKVTNLLNGIQDFASEHHHDFLAYRLCTGVTPIPITLWPITVMLKKYLWPVLMKRKNIQSQDGENLIFAYGHTSGC